MNDEEVCGNCIFRALLGYSKFCTEYENVDECPKYRAFEIAIERDYDA